MHSVSVWPTRLPGGTTWCVSFSIVEYSSVGPVFDGRSPVYSKIYVPSGDVVVVVGDMVVGKTRMKLLVAVSVAVGLPRLFKAKQKVYPGANSRNTSPRHVGYCEHTSMH